MTTTPAIEIVLFDLGGVVVRLTGGWQPACEIAGVPLPAVLNEQNFRDKIARFVLLHETGQITDQDFLEQVAAVASLTIEQVMAVMQAWIGDVFPGLNQLIDTLEQAKITTGCLSNTNAIHWQMMLDDTQRYQPLTRFNHHFASQLIGEAKPNPAIYKHVENHLNIDPPAIAFFDDSPANVDAACSRGWNARLIDATGDPAKQIAQHLIELNVLNNNHG